jgi:phosphoribosyl-dephospho-CoA transferase
MILKRHTLVDITDSGREVIIASLSAKGRDWALLQERYAQVILPGKAGARIPGIVRREDEYDRGGLIPVGFSAPANGKDGRLRIATFARLADLVSSTSPYELVALPSAPPRNACMTAFADARRQARALNLDLGVWGSAALECYTGLPYTHQYSDLDLLVTVAPHDVLASFLLKIEAMEKHFDLRIDVELDLPSGYGVHLKELFGSGRTVIGKSLTDVALMPRVQILAELPRGGESQIEHADHAWSHYDKPNY